jgi:hypothetical protein
MSSPVSRENIQRGQERPKVEKPALEPLAYWATLSGGNWASHSCPHLVLPQIGRGHWLQLHHQMWLSWSWVTLPLASEIRPAHLIHCPIHGNPWPSPTVLPPAPAQSPMESFLLPASHTQTVETWPPQEARGYCTAKWVGLVNTSEQKDLALFPCSRSLWSEFGHAIVLIQNVKSSVLSCWLYWKVVEPLRDGA